MGQDKGPSIPWTERAAAAAVRSVPAASHWRAPRTEPTMVNTSRRLVKNHVLLKRMVELPKGAPTAKIQALRLELRRFQDQQCDAAVQFHCIAIDLNLAAALDGRNDPSLRQILATNVENLADAVRSASLGISVAREA